jgi:hypothetical protein
MVYIVTQVFALATSHSPRYTESMIKIVNNDIYRDGEKVGWIEQNHIYNQAGQKMGHVSGNDIFDHSGNKKAFIDGEHIKIANESKKISIDDNSRHITGGTHSDVTRAAIRVLMGD